MSDSEDSEDEGPYLLPDQLKKKVAALPVVPESIKEVMSLIKRTTHVHKLEELYFMMDFIEQLGDAHFEALWPLYAWFIEEERLTLTIVEKKKKAIVDGHMANTYRSVIEGINGLPPEKRAYYALEAMKLITHHIVGQYMKDIVQRLGELIVQGINALAPERRARRARQALDFITRVMEYVKGMNPIKKRLSDIIANAPVPAPAPAPKRPAPDEADQPESKQPRFECSACSAQATFAAIYNNDPSTATFYCTACSQE